MADANQVMHTNLIVILFKGTVSEIIKEQFQIIRYATRMFQPAGQVITTGQVCNVQVGIYGSPAQVYGSSVQVHMVHLSSSCRRQL